MESARASKEKEVLIVEDDESLAWVVKSRLEDSGYAVHAETLGKLGISYAAEHMPSLVILDVNLPDCSGYQVARELRRVNHPWTLPILMLTIKDQPADQLRGFANGADAYLTKPFNSEELLQAVDLLTGETAARRKRGPEGR